MYFHTGTEKVYRQCFHETEKLCTSFLAAITHCLAGNFDHAFSGLGERCKLLSISTSILPLAV